MTTKAGKRRQAEKTIRGTETVAQRALTAAFNAEETETPNARTVEDLLTEWLAHSERRGRAAKTISENRRKVTHDLVPALGSIPLVALTAKDLDAQYTAWLTREVRPLSSSTVHHLHAIMSAALSLAVKWSYLPENPAAKATPPTVATRSTDVPSPEIVGKLIAQARKDNDRVMSAAIMLGFLTGARRGELCALRWSEVVLVDGVGGSIRIDRSLCEVDDEVSEKGTKTGKGRTVALDALSVVALQEIRSEAEAFATQASVQLVDDPYVLSQSADGSTWFQPGRLTDRFRLLCGRARVRGVRFHDLRHAHITQLIGAGIDVLAVAARAGHAQPSMTLNRYGHALPASGQAAALVIGSLLPPA